MKKENIITILVISLFSLAIIVGFMNIKKAKKEEKKLAAIPFESLMKTKKLITLPDSIAVLNIFSTISYAEESPYFGIVRSGAIYWLEKLKSIEDDKNVKAVILRLNSPGGTIGATQEIYNAVLRLREKGKIVVVSMGDIAASGAYYIACAADYIVANPGTLTGSIGVIISGMDLTELFKKIGISYNVIKSGKNKDILSPYRKMSPEEQKLLEEMVMDAYNQFFEAVAKGRRIPKDRLKELADGRVFSGARALENKLVDELGDYETALKVATEMAKITKPNIIELDKETNPIYGIFSMFGKRDKLPYIGKLEELKAPVLYITPF
ncbi:MAG: signal peptide peptidase SppA [Brevinematales bacterium]|nr:signal peptide peptidase SppA [Brevinematales bacterium]